MNAPTPDLSTRLKNTTETGIDAALFVPLLRLLAGGSPVTIDDLAAATGQTRDEVKTALAAAPDTEYDHQGQIIGQGLTLRPTRHRYCIEGHDLFTWCALDTLIFPTLIGKPATIESTSPTSGETITLTVDALGAVTSVKPANAVVSLVGPDATASIRSSFCNQVHYFTSPRDAQPWLDAHPGGEVVSIEAARRMGAAIVADMLDTASSGPRTGAASATGAVQTPKCDCG